MVCGIALVESILLAMYRDKQVNFNDCLSGSRYPISRRNYLFKKSIKGQRLISEAGVHLCLKVNFCYVLRFVAESSAWGSLIYLIVADEIFLIHQVLQSVGTNKNFNEVLKHGTSKQLKKDK